MGKHGTGVEKSNKLLQNLEAIGAIDNKTLDKYKKASLKEQKKNINRYSNALIEFCDDINPRAWRALTYIINHLDLYPLEALMADDDGTYFERHCAGKRTFAINHRTIQIDAADYGKAYTPERPSYATKLFYDDIKQLCASAGRLKSVIFDHGDEVESREAMRPMLEGWVLIKRTQKNGKITNEIIESLEKAKCLSACELILSDIASIMILFQMSNFTRIDQNLTNKMDPATKKLCETCFCLLDSERTKLIKSKKTNKLATYEKTHTLEKWNKILDSKNSSLPKLKLRLEKIAAIIDESTNLNCEVFLSGEKVGRSYQYLTLRFSDGGEKTKKAIVAPPRRIAKKVRPARPRLTRKPKADNTEAMLEWAKSNQETLMAYKKVVVKKGYKLLKPDIQRLKEYADIINKS